MESKKVSLFNNLSFWTLVSSIFISIFFFIPYTFISLEASKGFILSIGSILSLFFWLVGRLSDGKFIIPKDILILFAGAIPLVFLLSSLFSSSLYLSFFGAGFEVGTFGSMLVMFILFFLSAVHFQTESKIWVFIKSIFYGGLILSIFEIINILVGFDRFLPGMLKGVSAGNLIGSWNNFAIFFGLIVLLSLFSIQFLECNRLFKSIVRYFLLATGLIFLIIVNMPLVWLLVGLFAVTIFVYSLSSQHEKLRREENSDNKKVKFPINSFVVIILSLVFLFSNNLIGGFVSKYISVPSNDIRPSLITTSKVAYKSFLQNPVFGTGPNTFVNDWSLWKPKEIALTTFWNTDFSSGFSLMSTFAVTAGLLGFLVVLWFLIVYFMRSIQSIRIALKSSEQNHFILISFIISIYSWIIFVLYNPNIVILMLAFVSSGLLIGSLVQRGFMSVSEFSFLNDPRNSFFSILGLMIIMIASCALMFVYIQKFVSVVYFSKSVNNGSSVELLNKSEYMLSRASSLDENDVYYRNLSQIYLTRINTLIKDETISPDFIKSNLQQLIDLAQNSATAAISKNPKNYLNYLNLGNIYSSLSMLQVENSYENAVAAYEKSLELNPSNPLIVLSRASLEFSAGNNDSAREFINKSLEMKSNYTDALFLLSDIESSEGNLNEAIKQAESAAKISPYNSDVFFRLGLLRYNNSDYKGAVSAFEQAVILDPSYLNARYLLALSYQKVGRGDEALTQFKILSNVLPENEVLKKAISGDSSLPENPQIDESADISAGDELEKSLKEE